MEWFLLFLIGAGLLSAWAALSEVGERNWDEIDEWELKNDWKRPDE